MFFAPTYYRHAEFRTGFFDMLNLSPGIAAWGLMTGVAMVKYGLETPQALFMALAVFAGSAQLAAVPLMLAGAPMWVVLATAFCVNLRFVVFSVHLRAYVMHLPLWQRLCVGYFTGDLTYILFVKRFAQPGTDPAQRTAQIAYLMGNGGINWFSWTSFSVLGVLLADAIPSAWGLGFAGILALLGMACSLASSRLRWVAAVAAGVTGVVAYSLPLKLNIVVAITVAVALCLGLETLRKAPPNTDPQNKGAR
jgi:predicted branched-subunit amino acid permease